MDIAFVFLSVYIILSVMELLHIPLIQRRSNGVKFSRKHSPVSARYEVSLVASNCVLNYAFVSVMMFIILCFTDPLYNGTPLYI